jgi:hypothetical protein
MSDKKFSSALDEGSNASVHISDQDENDGVV